MLAANVLWLASALFVHIDLHYTTWNSFHISTQKFCLPYHSVSKFSFSSFAVPSLTPLTPLSSIWSLHETLVDYDTFYKATTTHKAQFLTIVALDDSFPLFWPARTRSHILLPPNEFRSQLVTSHDRPCWLSLYWGLQIIMIWYTIFFLLVSWSRMWRYIDCSC